MLRLALRMAGHRIAALVAVACAVLGAAALITGTGVLAESGLRSHLPAGRLSGADVVVSADQVFHPSGDLPIALPERRTVPARLVADLSGLPGVRATVGDIGFPAALVNAGGGVVPAADPQTAGHGWSSTGLLDNPKIDGTAPAVSGEVGLDGAVAAAAGVRIGDRVEVAAGGRPPAPYRVSAVVDAPGAGILFTDTKARALSGRTGDGPRAGTVDLVALRTAPGAADTVAAAARERVKGTGLVVTTGAGRGDVASPGAAASRSLLVLLAGSLAGVILLITGFVMASALTVSIAGQRRDLALMRAVGATPKQIRRLAAAQATLIAAVALVPGVALGYALAGRFRGLLADRGVVPSELPLTISPLPALATVLLTVLAVQLSARGAAWRTSRMPATEAVAESRSEPRAPSKARTRAGLLVITAATTLSVVPLFSRTVLGATTTSIAGILAAIGLALAGPALVRGIGTAATRRVGSGKSGKSGGSAATWLAMSNVRAYALRNAGIVSTLAMAVVFVLTYTLTQTTVLAATARDNRDGTLGGQRLSAPGLGGLPTGTLTEVRRTPGVRAAAPVGTTTVVWSYRLFGDTQTESGSALILTPDAADVLDLDVRKGGLDRLTGATIAVNSDVARSRGAEPGRRVRLVLGDGAQVDATVVAVYARGLGFGSVVLSHDLAAQHTTTGLDQSILVRTDGTAAARQELAALVASHPGLTLSDSGSGEGAGTGTGTGSGSGLKDTPPEVWINLAIIVVLLVYLLLSIANKLVAATAQRRVELAALRLIGTTPRQIRAMMRREAAVTAATALGAALLLCVVPLVLLGQGFLGRPWAAGPTWLLPVLAVTVTVTAFLTIEIPTRRALRTPPAHAIRAQ